MSFLMQSFSIFTFCQGCFCQGCLFFIGFKLLVSRITQKLLNRFLTKFCGKVAHEPLKKPLDFGGNPDHIWLGVRLGTAILHMGGRINSNSFAISAALADVCALLSVILVVSTIIIKIII